MWLPYPQGVSRSTLDENADAPFLSLEVA